MTSSRVKLVMDTQAGVNVFQLTTNIKYCNLYLFKKLKVINLVNQQEGKSKKTEFSQKKKKEYISKQLGLLNIY